MQRIYIPAAAMNHAAFLSFSKKEPRTLFTVFMLMIVYNETVFIHREIKVFSLR